VRAQVERVLVGYTCQQLFDLAADIESYPSFLPFCRAARILQTHALENGGTKLIVDNVFGWQGIRTRFRTETTLSPLTKIEVISKEHPFERLEIFWRFKEVAPDTCAVTFEIYQTFRSGVISGIVGLFASGLETRVIDAFAAEAARRYGPSRQA
jgi:coenzyme Q-binding protein COQ10